MKVRRKDDGSGGFLTFVIVAVFLWVILGCGATGEEILNIPRQRKTVILDPAGGRVTFGLETFEATPMRIPDGLDRSIIDSLILAYVTQDLALFGMDVIWDDGVARPDDQTFRIYVGGSNDDYIGLASTAFLKRLAIVFSDEHIDFCGEDEQRFARSVANTIGHEAGHLLGMRHSMRDPFDLMFFESPTFEWICIIDQRFNHATPTDEFVSSAKPVIFRHRLSGCGVD